MQVNYSTYTKSSGSIPKSGLIPIMLMGILLSGAVLSLAFGHWLLATLGLVLGTCLLHQLETLTAINSNSSLHCEPMTSLDGGIDRIHPDKDRSKRRASAVFDGGSFERAL